MASPQLEDGHTRIANELLERIMGLPISGGEFRVMLSVVRRTYGWGKTGDRISLTQFQKMTGLGRPAVCKSIKKLVSFRILLKVLSHYKINKNWEQWVVSKRKLVSNWKRPSIQSGTKVVSKRIPTKEIKETYTKEMMDAAKRVLSHLNNKANKQFREIEVHLHRIAARIKGGATEEDCIRVINSKVKQWRKNQKMESYIRPKTLFGPDNFEEYYGELPKRKKVEDPRAPIQDLEMSKEEVEASNRAREKAKKSMEGSSE